MRIVYVINSIKRSGPNQVLLNMVSGIKGKDYDIKVVENLKPNQVGMFAYLFGNTFNVNKL